MASGRDEGDVSSSKDEVLAAGADSEGDEEGGGLYNDPRNSHNTVW